MQFLSNRVTSLLEIYVPYLRVNRLEHRLTAGVGNSEFKSLARRFVPSQPGAQAVEKMCCGHILAVFRKI